MEFSVSVYRWMIDHAPIIMRLTIAAVGRLKRGPLNQLCAEYLTRIPWRIDLKEVETRKPLNGAALKAHEAELLRGAIPSGTFVVALDERGQSLDSASFAEALDQWSQRAANGIAFVIGGADGLDPALTGQADTSIAFGRQTWPHMMVRAMLMEQIYRAWTIQTRHPYHRA